MNRKLRDFIKHFLLCYAFMLEIYPIATIVSLFYVVFTFNLALNLIIHFLFSVIAIIVVTLVIGVFVSCEIVKPDGKIRNLALFAVVPIGGAIGTVLIANNLVYDINSGSPNATFGGILMALFVVYPITALIAAWALNNIDQKKPSFSL